MQVFQREIIQEKTVIVLAIQSLDATNARYVSRRVSEAMRGRNQIVVDLGALRYFDVSGFAVILKWVAGNGQGPDVRLCSQCGTVQALFELLGTSTVVPLFQSREEAMASFRLLEPHRRVGVDRLLPREEDALPGKPSA
jgi:anti-anti-sigma factor